MELTEEIRLLERKVELLKELAELEAKRYRPPVYPYWPPPAWTPWPNYPTWITCSGTSATIGSNNTKGPATTDLVAWNFKEQSTFTGGE